MTQATTSPPQMTARRSGAPLAFHSQELLYPGSRFRMAEELLAIYLREVLS